MSLDRNSDSQDSFYDDCYSSLMGTGIISKVWLQIHKRMEKPFRKTLENRVLEVGAGNGEHLQAVSDNIASYYATDIRVENLIAALGSRPNLVIEKQDVTSLTYTDDYFDRVIMTCVLTHLENPIKALSEMRRVTRKGGYISLYLPCEPGLLLRFIRRFTTHAKARRLGINEIDFLHFVEHRNYFIAMDYFVHNIFKDSKIQGRYYPFPFLSWNFNLFRLYTIYL